MLIRKLFVAAALSLSVAAMADDHPGHQTMTYAGQGSWSDGQGATGTYDSTLMYDGKQMVGTAVVGGETHTYIFGINESEDGSFKMSYNGQEVGTGFCSGTEDHKTMDCHYEASVNGTNIIESMAFKADGTLVRDGVCATASQGTFQYHEELTAQ